MLRRLFRPLITLALLSQVFTVTARSAAVFWEHEISAALDSRDSCYRLATIDTAAFRRIPLAGSRFPLIQQDTTVPWPFFLRGMACINDSDEIASTNFDRAVALAEKDPGRIWVLSQEFDRCGIISWEEKCLSKLELLFLTAGARSAPVIVQQLLFCSTHAKGKDSDFYVGWAQRFDRRSAWPSLCAAATVKGFRDVSGTIGCLRNAAVAMTQSWEAQLAFAKGLSTWLFLVVTILFAGILIGIGSRFLSPALHTIAERFPDVFTSRGKLLLTLAVFISTIFLGVIPFAWIFLFVVWRRLPPKEKALAIIALVLLLLAPLGIKLGDMFDETLRSDGSVQLYKQAIDEGYYEGLDSIVSSRKPVGGSDYLVHVAAAIYSCKKGQPLSAFPHIKVARMLAKDDPVVIVTAGNALYYASDLSGARNAYQQCIRLYPWYEPAYFNLGQYYFAAMETAKGMEYTTLAARLEPENVNAFIKKNNEYFSKDWPPLRQLMWPDFSPGYFWKTVFPTHCGTWDTAQERFGAMFFGLRLQWYIVVSLLLAALLLVMDFLIWSKDVVKKVSSCKLCQTPVCRKCKRGSICRDCFSATQQIRNEQIRQRIMGKIQTKAVRTHTLTALVLDILFPGTGMVFRSAPVYRSLPLVTLTAAIYATCASVAGACFEYPGWPLDKLSVIVYAGGAMYIGLFTIRALAKIVALLAKREVGHGA